MTARSPMAIDQEYMDLPADRSERHEVLVDCFGQFFFWLRNWSISASKNLIKSEEAREKLGTIRRRHYDGVANMPPEQQEAAMLLVEETVNGFGERLTWFLGNQGTDFRFGTKHAFRFQIQIELIDLETDKVIEKEIINQGGKRFFGDYWGRWLNLHRDK